VVRSCAVVVVVVVAFVVATASDRGG